MKPKTLSKLASVFLVLSGLAPGLVAVDPKPGMPAPSAVVTQLGWLAGNWRLEKAGRVIDEHWMAPAGGVMLGMARTVSKGRVISSEFTQIREGPGGEMFFIAQPSGQKEAAFRLISIAETEVVFENKEHDFPQTVSYRLNSDGTMLAYIEGPGPNGSTKRIEFPYKRVEN
jgi:hypothetical protein